MVKYFTAQRCVVAMTATRLVGIAGGAKMPRLYWRVKKNGRWTWTPAVYDMETDRYDEIRGCHVLLWWPSDKECDDQ